MAQEFKFEMGPISFSLDSNGITHQGANEVNPPTQFYHLGNGTAIKVESKIQMTVNGHLNSVLPSVPESQSQLTHAPMPPNSGDGINSTRAAETQSYIASDGDLFEVTVKPSMKLMKGEKIYKMTSNPRGLCLLINNEHFDKQKYNRPGTAVDARRLEKVFTEMGYRVISKSDLTGKQMEVEMWEFADRPEHKECDSSVVIILTHGDSNGILLGTDRVPVKLQDLKNKLGNYYCPALRNKPKMFFIQACRGNLRDKGVPEEDHHISACSIDDKKCSEKADSCLVRDQFEGMKLSPSLNDVIVSKSTVEENIAVLDEVMGSWYCQELVRVLAEKSCDTPLRDMLDEVSESIENRHSPKFGKQTTSYEVDGFKKKLYFNPKINE